MRIPRWREFLLLVIAFAMLAAGYTVVWYAYQPVWQPRYGAEAWRFFAPLGVMFLGWVLVEIALAARRCQETLLVPIVALLIGIGMLFLLRLAGGLITYAGTGAPGAHAMLGRGQALLSLYGKQMASFAIGWAALLGVILFLKDYRILARFKYVIAALAILLLLLTTLFGHAVEGQTLVLDFGLVAFQPHDPVKLLMTVFVAAYLVENRELIEFARGKYGLLTRMDFRYMGPLVALWVMVMAIIFKHNDLGAALLLFGTFLGMLYLGTQRKSYLAIGLALFLVGGVAAYSMSRTVQTRVAIWQDPWPQAEGKGFQICQSLMALGNGKVVGAGLAGGFPESIPAVHTDMIYAAIAEDLGLVGSVALVAVFLLLIGRIFHVAIRATDRFGQMLAAGLATALAVQTWVILAGTIKLIPLTGITLPFISYGGTSLLVNLLLVGLVLKVAEAPVTSPAAPSHGVPHHEPRTCP